MEEKICFPVFQFNVFLFCFVWLFQCGEGYTIIGVEWWLLVDIDGEESAKKKKRKEKKQFGELSATKGLHG